MLLGRNPLAFWTMKIVKARTHSATERQTGKEQSMGDKGGKKDKDKSKKQMTKKHDQKVKETKDKQAKKHL
jgi:hypothetical protein